MNNPESQLQPASAASAARPSGVKADIIIRSSMSPAEVVLEFQALTEPTGLWRDLTAIGWNVPPCPPRPSSAIEWVPDPVAGTDYTVNPWTVKEFRLGPGNWGMAQNTDVAVLTVKALRAHGAELFGVPEYVEELISSESAVAAPAAVPETPAPAPAHAITTGIATGRVVLINVHEDAAATKPQLERSEAISGKGKTEFSWHELPLDGSVTDADLNLLAAASRGAWTLDTADAVDARHNLRLIIPDMAADDKRLGKVRKLLGDVMAAHTLTPIVPGAAAAVLLSVPVPEKSYWMVESNLRHRFPMAIVRLED